VTGDTPGAHEVSDRGFAVFDVVVPGDLTPVGVHAAADLPGRRGAVVRPCGAAAARMRPRWALSARAAGASRAAADPRAAVRNQSAKGRVARCPRTVRSAARSATRSLALSGLTLSGPVPSSSGASSPAHPRQKSSKLATRVRFPSPAPPATCFNDG